MSDAAPARGALLADAASLLRPLLGLGVLFLLAPGLDTPWLLVAVLLACASDWADGRLARRAGRSGRAAATGRIVDGVCDAAFLLAVFAYCAAAELWTPPVWGRLARNWDGANWLPVWALLASFGTYLVRLVVEIRAGREPARSARGHAAGVGNYGLAVGAGIEALPGVDLGPWLLEPAMVGVALINAVSVPENLRLLFRGGGEAPKMPA